MLAFQDEKFFFGRETFVDGLVRVVQQQPLVAVIGSSGSGKSSVVFAGLIPKLEDEGSWLIKSLRPNKQPFYELAAALIDQLEPELGKTDKTIKAKELAQSIRQHGFTADVSAILKDNPGKRLLLVVDQFEELYTGCADTEQQQFVDALLTAVELASGAVTLVLTLRADFYSYAVNYPPFGAALNKYPAQNLSLMKAEEMQAAIERPAEELGVTLEEGLTQLILKDVKQEPGNLPLLEFALTQLWAKQSRGLLTYQAYSEIGGVAKALSNHAEAVYGKLSEQEQKQAQRIFLQLVYSQEGTKDTRWVATRGEVGEDCWGFLIQRLINARLVVTGCNEATGAETVEVAHEALIREWERLRGWVQDDYEFGIWRGRLRASLRQWKNANKDDGALLRGAPLVEAEDWQQKRLAELSPDERIFIQLSLALRDREEKEKPQPTPAEYRLPCRTSGGTFIFGWKRATDGDRACEYGVRVEHNEDRKSQLPSLGFPSSVQATKSLQQAQASPGSVLYCGARPEQGLLTTESGVLDDSCQEVVQKCVAANGGSECSLVSMGEWEFSYPRLNLSLACAKGPFNRFNANGSTIGNLLFDLTQKARTDRLIDCAVNIYTPEAQIITPGREQTLIRTTDSSRGIIIDVLLGSVIIKSISRPLGVPVRAGQSYSSADNKTTPIDPNQIAQSPDVQNFLDPNQTISPSLPQDVAEEIAAQIADHRAALGLRPVAPLSSYYLRVIGGSGSITSSSISAVAVGKSVNQVTGAYDSSTRTLRLDIAGRQVDMVLNAPLNDNVPIAFKVERVRPRFDRESTVSQFPKLVQNILAITEVEGGGTLRKQGNQIRGDFTVRGGFLGGRFNIQGNSSTFFPSSPSREGKSLGTGKFLLNVQIGTSSNIPAKR